MVDENTIEQAIETSRLKFVKPHVALMPDAHYGLGSTVGSVIPTVGAIMPAAIGVDIGCGMIAAKTNVKLHQLIDLDKLRHSIERSVPVSMGGYNKKPTTSGRVEMLEENALINYEQIDGKWKRQVGTLGSGNHFIEIVYDEDDSIWAFLHSGSRGIGNKIAQRHIKIAREFCEKYFIDLPNRDLAYLPEDTEEFVDYIRDMTWAQEFALANREEMMDLVINDLSYHVGDLEELERINTHHNYTQLENHMGQNVWLTRKGAIRAWEGETGLIPGSMGTPSYVVTGKGYPPAFKSCPHGAGRAYSRKAAKNKFSLEDLEKAMEGIEYRASKDFLDEIPGAYKDISRVMEDSQDLCEIKHEFRQVLNVKGT